jgi:preprotein translocase subunit SecF
MSALVSSGYKDSVVSIQKTTTTDISIKTNVENDQKVNILSQDIKTILVAGKYIATPNDIVSQTVTGPSVGEYMQSSAKQALIVGLILMAVYMMFSFAGIRKTISPAILA